MKVIKNIIKQNYFKKISAITAISTMECLRVLRCTSSEYSAKE